MTMMSGLEQNAIKQRRVVRTSNPIAIRIPTELTRHFWAVSPKFLFSKCFKNATNRRLSIRREFDVSISADRFHDSSHTLPHILLAAKNTIRSRIRLKRFLRPIQHAFVSPSLFSRELL